MTVNAICFYPARTACSMPWSVDFVGQHSLFRTDGQVPLTCLCMMMLPAAGVKSTRFAFAACQAAVHCDTEIPIETYRNTIKHGKCRKDVGYTWIYMDIHGYTVAYVGPDHSRSANPSRAMVPLWHGAHLSLEVTPVRPSTTGDTMDDPTGHIGWWHNGRWQMSWLKMFRTLIYPDMLH